MVSVWWSIVLTLVGVTGFWLSANQVWWSWYVNLANQVVWLAYAVLTQQWGFLLGVLIYTIVFTRNAVKWTREERARGRAEAARA